MTSKSKSRFRAALFTAILAALSPGVAWAQDPATPPPPKDEGLDNLLKKLEDPKPDPAAAPKEADKPKTADAEKPAPKEDEKSKPSGGVAPKDESLDSLLEKLGTTVDKPRADDKPPAGGGGGMPPDEPPMPTDPSKKSDPLSGDAQDLDDHLKKLTGKNEPGKKKPQQGQGQGDGQKGEGEQGPLDQVIKEMRDVEERLGQPDTGEGTRQKQAEIVKNLDTLIEQMNQAKSQSQAMKQLRKGQKPGQPNPGQDQPGAQANGPPPSRPSSPNGKAPVALDKDVWGQLPAQLREEMGNVFKEGPLPNKLDLIRQYYLSLGKKNAAREE